MTTRWIDSNDAASFSAAFWDRHRAAADHGRFWAEEAKALVGDPAQRLKIAMDNLPLPAAFREAAKSLRAAIREKRKRKALYERELAFLYWLAAVASFGIPYSSVIKEPGFNVLQSIPGQTVANLEFSYSTLGYRKLELLNKTDVKWITERWGEPDLHTTLNALHLSVWQAAEKRLLIKRNEERERFEAEMRKLFR